MPSRGVAGRDRYRRDSPPPPPPRVEESSHKRPSNPPSRHLWLGNLSHRIVQSDLSAHLLRYGELESIAFQPGRSYAFINYKNDEDAIVAMKALQGFHIAGNPVRIEFAKPDKLSSSSHDEHYSYRRDALFSHRDSRARRASPDQFYPERDRNGGDRDGEPSEVLWMGFPASLKVDETILRKAFSPFGEIEKITTFPGRSYAFIQYRSVSSACRAKETLHGKLFGNPRVHICFAKNESTTLNAGRIPLSPHLKSSGHGEDPIEFRHERASFGGSPLEHAGGRSHFVPPDHEFRRDSEIYGFDRKHSLYPDESARFDHFPFRRDGSSPQGGERSSIHFRELPNQFARRSPAYEEPWELQEDGNFFHGSKRLKTEASFPHDRELPEYPFSALEEEKHVMEYKPIRDQSFAFPRSYGENENWKARHDHFPRGPVSLSSDLVEMKRFVPEPEQPALNLWKWEGVLAKAGTPVCHARGFPVGKVPTLLLPEILDCTAKTSLDMVAKYHSQASAVWVVFFVPASDDDISYYNEFMKYLQENRRAAVAKLDGSTTLFIVPPSDFSEKILKVPGDMSISGVLLRLDQMASSSSTSLPLLHHNEKMEASLYAQPPHAKPNTVSSNHYSLPANTLLYQDPTFYSNAESPLPASFAGNLADSYKENRLDFSLQQRNQFAASNWPPGSRIAAPSSGVVDLAVHEQEHQPLQEGESQNYLARLPNSSFSGSDRLLLLQEQQQSSSTPAPSLNSKQLAELASSILGQPKQGLMMNENGTSIGEDYRQVGSMNQFDKQFRVTQAYVSQNQVGMEVPQVSPFGQLQQVNHRQSSAAPGQPVAAPLEVHSGGLEEADADPQKRLQATLQLAATLLQQIQQGKGA